ncbi:ferredoxin reductase [Parafrankia elaeagni]|uniref:ferredoxin reductase n=1 Tax=Parafrankia elaeagni TaxID=222534 RepID=UPI0012B5D8D7|nr:ferredoxin reductase [Parafrankia elaeagni]
MASPLRPDDYWATVNPLWSRRRLSGRVEAVSPETPDTSTVVVRPGLGWRGGLAGQHIEVGVGIDGVWHRRPFSLSSPPRRPDGLITITVKARPGGLVSRNIVHALAPGRTIRIGHPAGRFVLPEKLPPRLLFVTAGSGITPVMAMLRELAESRRMPDVLLAHSARDASEVIFGEELRRLAVRFPSLRLHEHHTCPGGRREPRLTMAALAAVCTDLPERMAWVCGPPGLVDDAEAYWRAGGIADRLLTERFHPAVRPGSVSGGPTRQDSGEEQVSPDGPVRQAGQAGRAGRAGRAGSGRRKGQGGDGGRVRFVRSGREITVTAGTTLLAAGEEAGVALPSGCRMGICYSCLVPLAGGRVRDLRTGEEHGAPGDLIQTCVSAAGGDVDIDL